MNVDGACDGDTDDDEDGASVKDEPVEEGDFDLGIVPADAELEGGSNEEDDFGGGVNVGFAGQPAPSGSADDRGGEGATATAHVRRDPLQR